MGKYVVALVAAVWLIAGGFLFGSAQAAQGYCWYSHGWNGPGYYQCGSAWRRGYGWGGPYGWHGWGHHMYGHHMYGHHMGGWGHHHMMGW